MPNLLLDASQRGAVMRSIRGKNTKPELIAFAELRARGVTFQRHYERVVGKPDIAKPRKRLAVFIDGDFWHGREIERVIAKYGEDSYWANKLRQNMARDKAQDELLCAEGWSVLRVWASDLTRVSTRGGCVDRMEQFLRSKDDSAAERG
jgi:DNA mismatch endonuclease (patch repair protein)